MSVFFDMFVPSRRHVEEEQNRLEWTREEEGEGEPHRGPIDLDSGVVTIKAAGEPPDGAEDHDGAIVPDAAAPAVTRPAASRTRRGEP